MEEIKKVALDEGTLAYLQMLSYEADGLRVLNCQIMQSGGANGEQYNRFLEQYREAARTYQTAFAEIVRMAVPDLSPDYQYEISFMTGELIVSRKAGME